MIYCEDKASDALTPYLTHQGFLRVDSVIGRPGVLTYTQPDGSVRRELRLPEDLQKTASLDTARGIPVTNGHPQQSEIPLCPGNVKFHEVGHTGESVVFEGDQVKTAVTVKDARALAEIDQGKIQLSPGYFKSLEYSPGVWVDDNGVGHAYDAIQRDIRYDHVAIVQNGRAGSGVALGLSTDGLDYEPVPKEGSAGGGTMAVQLTLDGGIQVQIQDAGTAGLIQAAIKARDEKIEKLELSRSATQDADDDDDKKDDDDEDDKKTDTDADDEDDKKSTDAETAKASLDAANEELAHLRKKAAAEVSTAVRSRLALERKAGKILGASVSLDELDDSEIKAQVVVKAYPGLESKLKAASPAYIEASFDAACAHFEGEQSQQDHKLAALPLGANLSADKRDPAPKQSPRDLFLARQAANRTKSPLDIAAGK